MPSQFLLGSLAPFIEGGLGYVSSVGGVLGKAGLSDDDFLVGDASILVDLLDGSSVPISVLGINKQELVGVIGGVSLVVELDVIPVDQITDLLVDLLVGAVRVDLISDEIGAWGA